MATSSNYYIDTATFATATAVFVNQNLSVLAPDGIYKFGTTTRQQSGGVLLAPQVCAACETPCGTSIGGGGATGVYTVNLNVGNVGTGAIRIRFNPDGIPDGIRVTYDGVVYNKLSSESVGVRQSSNPGHYTIVGTTGATGTCASWYPSGGTITQNVKVYNPATSAFIDTVPPSTQTNTIDTGDFFIGARVNDCWMVIPKINNTPSSLFIEMIGPCTSTGWTFSAFCPAALPTFPASNVFASNQINCFEAMPNTYYFAKVHGAADTFVGLYDYVFTDVNGQFPLANGYYRTTNVAAPNGVIQVSNGVVVSLTPCILPVTGLTWATTVNNACNATPWVISNQNLKIRYDVTDSADCGGTCNTIQEGTATATITVGASNVNMGLSFSGIGELEASNFEKITFSLDGTQIAAANAAGGGLGCQMGAVIQSFTQAPPYLLLANSVHTLFIDFTTNDQYYHVGAYYEVDLTFTNVP